MGPTANSDGLINCLRQRQDSFVIHPNIYLLKSVPFIKYCGIRTVTSTWTASLALSADALVPCFLLAPRLFHRDPKLYCRISGLGTVKTNYRDPKLCSHLPGLAKNAAPRHPSLPLGAGSRQLIKPPGR